MLLWLCDTFIFWRVTSGFTVSILFLSLYASFCLVALLGATTEDRAQNMQSKNPNEVPLLCTKDVGQDSNFMELIISFLNFRGCPGIICPPPLCSSSAEEMIL